MEKISLWVWVSCNSQINFFIDKSLDDTLAKGLVDTYPEKTPMGITGENLATKYNITREACDEWALESQKRWAKGKGAILFRDSALTILFSKCCQDL